MRVRTSLLFLGCTIALSACIKHGSHPQDPYEPLNRKINDFNLAFDATVLKPPAKLYKAVLPGPVRKGVDNFYNNLSMLPTVANDLLQRQWKTAANDTGRFMINSTIGLAGIFDVATEVGVPEHYNDMGLTFASWGDKQSPFIMLPFLGPSTIRDTVGITFDYSLFMPYPYFDNKTVTYSMLGVRYIDLRAQLLDTEKLMQDALDRYAFIRDAYLQNRNYRITGESPDTMGSMYIDEDEAGDYIDDEPAEGLVSNEPSHDTHRTV